MKQHLLHALTCALLLSDESIAVHLLTCRSHAYVKEGSLEQRLLIAFTYRTLEKAAHVKWNSSGIMAGRGHCTQAIASRV
ncbi:hypothetical protein FKM82_012356 [Ascaphus truei]